MTLIHLLAKNDRTACNLPAYDAPRKGGRAPMLSTNKEHVTCSKCKGE